MKKAHRIFDYTLIITFLIGLFVPLALTNNREESLIEKRKLIPFPEWKWNQETIRAFPGKFQEFFGDHFGFRDNLAQVYYLSGTLLASSSSPRVIIGKDQWYFYISPEDGNSLEDYRKNDELTREELERWKLTLTVKNAYLKKKGIYYLFVIAPDKHSIYGEYYPSRIRRVGRQSRLDQFMEYMRDSDVPILDLRQALIESKPSGQLYLKTDTHWNLFGAAIAQYEIMHNIVQHYPSIHPIRYEAQDFSWQTSAGGDMAAMLNLSNVLKEQFSPTLVTPVAECERLIIEENFESPIRSTFMTNCPSSAPSALIFRDSFFEALRPYISPYFSKSVYVWKNPYKQQTNMEMIEEYIAQYSPDIMIEERVERLLKYAPALPQQTSEADQFLLESQFQTGELAYQLPVHFEQAAMRSHQMNIIPDEHGYSLISEGDDPYLILPKFEIDTTKDYIIKVVLHAPQKTGWQIFYRTPQMSIYDEEHSFSGRLAPGKNICYVALSGKDIQEAIRIDPGSSGEYRLEAVEIRAVTNIVNSNDSK